MTDTTDDEDFDGGQECDECGESSPIEDWEPSSSGRLRCPYCGELAGD